MLFASYAGEETDNDLLIQMGYIPETFTGSVIRNALGFFYENESRQVFSQMIALRRFKIWDHHITILNNNPIYPTTNEAGYKLHFMLSDIKVKAAVENNHAGINGDQEDKTKVELESGQMTIVHVPKGKHLAPIPLGTHNFFHIDLAPSLWPLLKKNKKAIALFTAMKKAKERGEAQINTSPVAINVYCMGLIEQIRQHAYSGQIADIYLQKKCWQLLTYFAEAFAKPNKKVRRTLTPKDVNTLDNVKAMMKLQLHERFNADLLGKNFNVAPQVLSRNFQQLFHSSIYDFSSNYKMEQAFKHLVKSNMSLDKLAQLLGFRNTATFNRAFHTYWGYQPAYFRQLKSNTR